MSLIVVATKLSQPFDDIIRYSESESDPGIVQINWSKWAESIGEPPVVGLKKDEEVYVTDKDVVGMNEEAMDDYLDYFQKNWLDDRPPKGKQFLLHLNDVTLIHTVPEQILELFPVTAEPHSVTNAPRIDDRAEHLKRVQQESTLRNTKPAPDGTAKDVTRPGQYYRRYRSFEQLPKDAKAFYEVAAECIGIDVPRLVKAVFQIEVQLEKWNSAHRKKRQLESLRSFGLEDSDSESEWA